MPFQYPAIINPGQITNTEVNASAAIALSKLATGNTIYTDTRMKMVSFTINISTTGNQSVTGAGFTPKSYVIIGAIAGAGGVPAFIGMSDGGSADGSIFNNLEIGAGQWASTGSIGLLETAAGTYNVLSHVSMDADGFTFSKTKTGTPTGTVTCYVKFER